MSRLLALDQSSKVTGWAYFKDGKIITHGKLSYNDTDIGDRLMKLRKDVRDLIDLYNINEIVLEDIQLQGNVVNNVQTFKILAEVFGVLEELFTEIDIKYTAVLSTVWKSTLGIKGKDRPAQKRAAQEYILNNYNIKATQDEIDSICIGLHHVSTSGGAWD